MLAFAPVGIRQLLVEAEVAEGTSPGIVAFWDQLAALARGQRDERLNAIGRRGERLSIALETERTGRLPRWVSIDSNADGYDILSVVGADDPASLRIEVKTSTRGTLGGFVLTRNEWDTAISASAYRLHLWDVADNRIPRFADLGLADIHPHVPTDCGGGSWEQVTMPFSLFSETFAPYDRLLESGN